MSEITSLIPSIAISASGLNAESRRMEVIANNMANANTTRGADGRIFRRKELVFAEVVNQGVDGRRQAGGVEIKGIVDDGRAPQRIYRPGHPDADGEGYVEMPDVNPVEEMVNMMSATRAYEANLAAIRSARAMATKAIGIGQ